MKELEGMPTIHYTEMAETPATSPIYRESQTFRRELPRLLAEGHEGKWALIQGDEVIGLFATFEEGYRVGRELLLFQRFIVQPVRERQPLIRMTAYFRHATLKLPAQPGRNGSASDDGPERSRHGSAGSCRNACWCWMGPDSSSSWRFSSADEPDQDEERYCRGRRGAKR